MKKPNFNINKITLRELTSVETQVVAGGGDTWVPPPIPKPPKPTGQPTSSPCLPQPSEATYPGCKID